jgi:hypothetical protein
MPWPLQLIELLHNDPDSIVKKSAIRPSWGLDRTGFFGLPYCA